MRIGVTVFLLGVALRATGGAALFEDLEDLGEGELALELAVLSAPELEVAKLLLTGDQDPQVRAAAVERWIADGAAEVDRRLRAVAGTTVAFAEEDGNSINVPGKFKYVRGDAGSVFVEEDVRRELIGLRMAGVVESRGASRGLAASLEFSHDFQSPDPLEISPIVVPLKDGRGKLRLPIFFRHRAEMRFGLPVSGVPKVVGMAKPLFLTAPRHRGRAHLVFARGGAGAAPLHADPADEVGGNPGAHAQVHFALFSVDEDRAVPALMRRDEAGFDEALLLRCFGHVAKGDAQLAGLLTIAGQVGEGAQASSGQSYPGPGMCDLVGDPESGNERLVPWHADIHTVGMDAAIDIERVEAGQTVLDCTVSYHFEAPAKVNHKWNLLRDKNGDPEAPWFPHYSVARFESSSVFGSDKPVFLGAVRPPFQRNGERARWLLLFARAESASDGKPVERPPQRAKKSDDEGDPIVWRGGVTDRTKLRLMSAAVTTFSVHQKEVLGDIVARSLRSDKRFFGKMVGMERDGRASIVAHASGCGSGWKGFSTAAVLEFPFMSETTYSSKQMIVQPSALGLRRCGTEFECSPSIHGDGTVELNLVFEHHRRPPGMIPYKASPAGDLAAEFDVGSVEAPRFDTSRSAPSVGVEKGGVRLISVSKPPRADDREGHLHLTFLQTWSASD